jgi:hypothetical protein
MTAEVVMSRNKIYINDVGIEFIVDCGMDISNASSTILEVRKPDGTIVNWIGTIYSIDNASRYIRYVSQAGDLNQAGEYQLQSKPTIASWSGHGDTTKFVVYNRFS